MKTYQQKVLEDCIDEMGVRVTKHPSGVLILRAHDEMMTIFPGLVSWSYRISREGGPVDSAGRFEDFAVQKFVHFIQRWAWRNGVR